MSSEVCTVYVIIDARSACVSQFLRVLTLNLVVGACKGLVKIVPVGDPNPSFPRTPRRLFEPTVTPRAQPCSSGDSFDQYKSQVPKTIVDDKIGFPEYFCTSYGKFMVHCVSCFGLCLISLVNR